MHRGSSNTNNDPPFLCPTTCMHVRVLLTATYPGCKLLRQALLQHSLLLAQLLCLLQALCKLLLLLIALLAWHQHLLAVDAIGADEVSVVRVTNWAAAGSLGAAAPCWAHHSMLSSVAIQTVVLFGCSGGGWRGDLDVITIQLTGKGATSHRFSLNS